VICTKSSGFIASTSVVSPSVRTTTLHGSRHGDASLLPHGTSTTGRPRPRTGQVFADLRDLWLAAVNAARRSDGLPERPRHRQTAVRRPG
jgi:hypothetical protein